MQHISRRGFLGSVAAAGLASAATAPTANAQPDRSAHAPVAPTAGRIPHEVEEHRVLVVGSGFGGGVSALRLAQAGVPVVVLERGRRWPAGPNSETFPSATSPDERALWFRGAPELFGRPVDLPRFTGLLEASVGQNMTAVVPTGVGGGSLIYQGMALQPTEELFSDWLPDAIDWREMDRSTTLAWPACSGWPRRPTSSSPPRSTRPPDTSPSVPVTPACP